MKTTNITLVGVGGQGIILTADILARAAALAGFDVKKTEIHGMSQRGGSVSSEVRFGDKVFSPIVPAGEADVLVSFDKLEALRNAGALRADGKALVDARYIVPITVSSGMQSDVEDLDGKLAAAFGDRLAFFDSAAIAAQVGNPRTANMATAGALSKLLPFPVEIWHRALEERLPAKLLEINRKAFDLGRGAN